MKPMRAVDGPASPAFPQNIFFLDTEKRLPHHKKISLAFLWVLWMGREVTVKRSCICFFLLFISFLIPLNVAYLYHAYYGEIDFLARKHFTAQEEEDFLTVVKKNPRILYYPGLSAQHRAASLLEFSFLQVFSPFFSQNVKKFVLRC
jgi:hypothetical protein